MLRSTALRAALALFVFALPAAAQSYVFRMNQSASNFTWTGTSTLGPIQGNPSNTFQFAGTTQLDLAAVPSASFTTGAFTGGDAFTVPDIHGRIPNPIPIFPPLATIDVVGLHVVASSPSFPMLAGSFNASVTITAIAGTMTVTPLGGSATSSPLAGSTSAPTAVTGTVSLVGSGLHLVAPISTTFPFADPTSGASGSITLTGTLDATYALYSPYCFGDGSGTACPCANNSLPAAQAGCLSSIGSAGRLTASGLPIVTADTLALNASGMPATVACLYFQGTLADNGGLGSLRGDGLICTAGTLLRLGTRTNSAGASSFPGPGGPLVSVRGGVNPAGGTYFYQAWYRNAAAFCTPETFNLTNGVAVTWLP
ncbi:MAG: hypothetical protein IPJ77_16160 [Planctomycetes bacterium]|nr:hypothetical protein [Planctomycetota bacterium]